MYIHFSKCGNYRKSGDTLFKKSENSFIAVWTYYKMPKNIEKAIKRFENEVM